MIEISRRDLVIGAAGAAAAFGLPGRLTFVGAAEAASVLDAGVHKYKVGSIEVMALGDGAWQRKHDAGFIKNATIDQTKAALKAAGLSDEGVTIPFTVTALRNGDQVTLIDSGTGAQLAPTAGKLAASMKMAGIDPAKVKTIVVSHYHPDHIFGMMAKGTNAEVFPNAEILVPAAEHKWWTDPANIAKLPEARRGLAKRIQDTLGKWKNVKPYAGGKEVAPGMTAIDAFGHTPGHTAFRIASGGQQLYVMGDAANIPALFVRNPTWHAAFDMDAKMAEATRMKLFGQAAAEKAMVAGYHFGMPNVGTLSKDGAGFAFEPVKA